MTTDNSLKWWHKFQCPACSQDSDAEHTRATLLNAAFAEIHKRGFQAASVQNILNNTNLTKGAFYHHFKSKQAMGYAVVDEILRIELYEQWIKPLENADDPIVAIRRTVQRAGAEMTAEDIQLGCPINNLAQEMSALDEGFRTRIEALYREWQMAIAEALNRGKELQIVRSNVNTEQFALVFIATLEGCLGMAKSGQRMEILMECGSGLLDLLESLRNA